MKKLYLLFIMVLVLTACGQQQDTNNTQNNQNQEKKQVNQTPVGGPNQKVLEAVKKIKDVKECDSKFTKKKDIITCKMEYIIQNENKLDEKVCDNIKDKVNQKNCKNIFLDKKIKEIAVKKIKDVKECDSKFTKKENIITCKMEYIIQNADKLNLKVCKNIEDINEQQVCKSFFKNK